MKLRVPALFRRRVQAAEQGAATVSLRYDAASFSKQSRRSWAGVDALDADSALSPAVRRTVSHRARFEFANNGDARRIVNTLAVFTVGTGPRLQLRPEGGAAAQDDDVSAALSRREARFRAWSRAVGLARTLRIARSSKAVDGEAFLVKFLNPALPGAVKLSVRCHEAEQVAGPWFGPEPERWDDGSPKEVDGILLDRHGNPTGYRFLRVHPGAACAAGAFGDSGVVPASRVIHYANLVRPGQHRGESEISPTLCVFNDLRRYTTAVLSAAERAAELSMIFHTDADPDEGGPDTVAANAAEIDFQRGMALALPRGWNTSQMRAEQPTATHEAFVRTKVREIAGPFMMPLNIAMGDSSGYNYASGRLDHQAFRRAIDAERDEIGRVVLDDLLAEWRGFDETLFPEDYRGAAADAAHEWMWDGFEHVDPLKEANAAAARISAGISSEAIECAREGLDWEAVVAQRARIAERKRALGLPDETSAAKAATTKKETEDED